MSPLEQMIWNILGYAAMPGFFVGGFIVTAVFTCFLLEALGKGEK